MAKNVKRIILSEKQPNNKHIAWAKPSGDNIDLKIFEDNKWKPISGSSSTKKTYPVDPNAYLITSKTTIQDIDGLYRNSIISELGLSDDNRSWTKEQSNLYKTAFREKLEQTPFRTEEHGMAHFNSNISGTDLIFVCDDDTVMRVCRLILLNGNLLEYSKNGPFKATRNGLINARTILTAKTLGINIDKYWPDISALNNAIDDTVPNPENYSSEEEYNKAFDVYITKRDEIEKELMSIEFVTDDHGNAKLISLYGIFQCEDGTILGTGREPIEYPPIHDYIRFQLITNAHFAEVDEAKSGLLTFAESPNYKFYIADTKDTYGAITKDLFNEVTNTVPELYNTIHLYTDTIYVPITNAIKILNGNIKTVSNFFKLHSVDYSFVTLPSDIQELIQYPNGYTITESTTKADLPTGELVQYNTINHGYANAMPSSEEDIVEFQCEDGYLAYVGENGTNFINPSDGMVRKSPSLKYGPSSPTTTVYNVSKWKITVQLLDDTLAYIFMTLKSDGTLSIDNTLYFSDNVSAIPNYNNNTVL